MNDASIMDFAAVDENAPKWPLFAVKLSHGFIQRGWDLAPHELDSSKPTLVFVHGNPSNKWLWRHWIAAAKATHRCIAVDHIGMGDSDKPAFGEYDFHFEQRLADLQETLNARGVTGPVILIVHDWGGVIGLRWAQDHPARVAKLVITNTAAFPLMAHKKLAKEIGFVRNTWLGAWVCKYLNGFQRGAIFKGVIKRMSPAAKQGYLRAHPTAASCEAIVRFVKDIPLASSDRGFDKLVSLHKAMPQFNHIPVQLQWGLRDFVFDGDYLAEFEKLLPNAEVYRYEDAGHWLSEDRGADIVPRFMRFIESAVGR